MPYSSGTVHGLLEAAASRKPAAVALQDDERSLTWADWLRISGHIATMLRDAGAGRGHVIGVITDRSVMLPCVFTAVSMIGARFVSIDPSWPVQERGRVFDRWSERLAVNTLPDKEHAVDREDDLILSGEVFSGHSQPDWDMPDDEDAEVYLNVTSASTGQAKVAPTTHRQLLSNTAGVCTALGLTEDDVHLSLFGVFGHPHELFMRGLHLEGRTVLTEKRFPRDLLDLMAETGVTAVMALPTQLGGISRMCTRKGWGMAGVRMAEAGGMHVSEEFVESFTTRTGVDLMPVWGSTETAGVSLIGEAGSAGFTRVVDGYTVELRDSDSGRIVGKGRGEMWIRGAGVVEGYLGDRPQTEEAFSDGWFRTGDMFNRSSSGKLEFLGRRGGLIKASGLKVFPLEVELAILKHPGVADVCVVGSDHPVRGEMPTAFIVPTPGTMITDSHMREYLRGMLDEYKIPRLFNFVSGLPRTVSGKIDRKAVGTREVAPDFRGELLRADVELVRLLNHRDELMSRIGGGFDPTWVDEQEDNAVGHNAGPASDSAVRSIVRFIISELGKG